MKIVYIDSAYTDYLRKVDNRVSFNKNITYQRPYIGILFSIGKKEYFAPLTSSGKNNKLIDKPMPESVTFFPLDKCRLGGINLNNMIPVVKSVYWLVDLNILTTDKKWQVNKKNMLRKTIRFIRKHRESIIIKSKFLYNLSAQGKLFGNRKEITCDFKRLEEAAKKWKGGK